MELSFKQMQQVPDELLGERIELIHELEDSDTEAYRIVKDRLTGEHYLHYFYIQINISGGGEEEAYHQLMPLEHDDVLELIFDQPSFHYPEAWSDRFLRNGPDGHYVWFDPKATEDYEASLQLAKEIQRKMEQFKASGQFDAESTEKLMQELDELKKKKPGKHQD